MSQRSGVTLLIGRRCLFTSLERNKCKYSNYFGSLNDDSVVVVAIELYSIA